MMEDNVPSRKLEPKKKQHSSDSFLDRTAPLHGLLFMFAAEIIVSVAFINYFCRSFKISRALIAIHLPLVAGLLVITTFAPGLLLYNRRIRESGFTRYLLVTVPALVFVSLLFIYVADYGSNVWLGNNINYKLLRIYFSSGQLSDLVFLSRWIYVSLVAFVILILLIYLVFAKTIYRGVEDLLLPDRIHSLFSDRRRSFKSYATIVLILLGYTIYVCVLARYAPYSDLLSGDPIVSLMRSSTDVYDENYPAFIGRLKEEERRCRADYPREQKFEKRNVIIIIVDALRADHTQMYGYRRPTTPFLESLFETGRLRKVEFATSTCAETACGVFSTLFSKTLRRQIGEDFKLYDLLHDQGYQTYFLLSGNHSWRTLKEKYGQEMTLYFDGTQSGKYASSDDRIIFQGFEKVPNHTDSPAFFYIHLMSAHLSGIKQEAYGVYQPSNINGDLQVLLRGEMDQTSAINNYDNGVTQADAVIREIFGVLGDKGYLQNSLIVILADHGDGLGERGKASYGHGSLYQEFIRIPLLIYDTSPAKYANLKFATQIDVAPTIVDRLGLPIPACWQGASLMSANIKAFTTHQNYLKGHPCYAVLYRTDAAMYKYLYCTVDKREEFYELISDPNEQLNLIEVAEPALIQRMRDELARSLAD